MLLYECCFTFLKSIFIKLLSTNDVYAVQNDNIAKPQMNVNLTTCNVSGKTKTDKCIKENLQL